MVNATRFLLKRAASGLDDDAFKRQDLSRYGGHVQVGILKNKKNIGSLRYQNGSIPEV